MLLCLIHANCPAATLLSSIQAQSGHSYDHTIYNATGCDGKQLMVGHDPVVQHEIKVRDINSQGKQPMMRNRNLNGVVECQDLFNKLASYAALVGVIGAIGGGFYAWGEFSTRLRRC
jgi:hypothetical protein